jgi:hypothetical protein
MNRTEPITALCAVALMTFVGIGCTRHDEPEQRLRALIAKAEQAVEKKDIAELRGYVSDRYADDDGRDRRAIDGMLRIYLLRNESIHLLTRIASVAFVPPNQAKVVIYVAMAGRPITADADLAAFNGNLYRFDLDFADDARQWRLIRAAWRPAEPSDFIR